MLPKNIIKIKMKYKKSLPIIITAGMLSTASGLVVPIKKHKKSTNNLKKGDIGFVVYQELGLQQENKLIKIARKGIQFSNRKAQVSNEVLDVTHIYVKSDANNYYDTSAFQISGEREGMQLIWENSLWLKPKNKILGTMIAEEMQNLSGSGYNYASAINTGAKVIISGAHPIP